MNVLLVIGLGLAWFVAALVCSLRAGRNAGATDDGMTVGKWGDDCHGDD